MNFVFGDADPDLSAVRFVGMDVARGSSHGADDRYRTPSISGHTVNGSRRRAGHQTQKNMKTIEEGSESRLSSTARGIWNAKGKCIPEMRSGGIDAS